MSVNLTKFTRALRIYPSQYPIPSPYVLAQGTQTTEGNVCFEFEVINEQSCEGQCQEIYAENNGENVATISYTTCDGESNTQLLYGGSFLGCLSGWQVLSGDVNFFSEGTCGPTPGPAQVIWLDCDGNQNSQDVECQSSFYMGCVREILEINGGECYTNEYGTCGNFAPNILYSNGLDFAVNGVSAGDIVYVYDESNIFSFITVVTGLVGNNFIYTQDYIPSGYNFTIYQQSAQSGLGNKGCTLFFPEGYEGGALSVISITDTTIYSSNYAVYPNTLFPIQASYYTLGNLIIPVYALW